MFTNTSKGCSTFTFGLQGESTSLCWLTKGEQCATVYRLDTSVLSDIYKYVNYIIFIVSPCIFHIFINLYQRMHYILTKILHKYQSLI